MSIILRCPKCEKHYESPDNALKQSELTCPECGLKSYSGDFCAMMFCPECRGKLAVSLSVLNEKRLVCPRCDKAFSPNVSIDLEDDTVNTHSLFEEDDEDETSTFKAGDFFDKYEIIRLLGRGGMGEVYLAKHLFLHREVALKIMLSNIAAQNPVFAKRFVREAKIANRISSPNLIPVFDVGIDSKTETLFLAMEYINGINVSDMIKTKGVFDENTTLHIAYKVASALKAMEEANVVHRDIKPSNIMIDVSGEIKLADLGIAKSANNGENELTLTQDSMVFGTPNFASPEQCRASHNVDCRADIYSLGATMYHMVAGYPPFRGNTPMDTMLQVLNDPAPSAANLPQKLSPGFVALIKDMLEKDPAKRPQNADELQQRISEIFNGDCGLRSKLIYLSKSASQKLRPISGMINDVPSRIFNCIPWEFFRKLTGIAVILLILFSVFFFGVRRRDYFRIKYNELKKNLESAEVPDAGAPEISGKEEKKTKKTAPQKSNINRSRLYKSQNQVKPKVSGTPVNNSDTEKISAVKNPEPQTETVNTENNSTPVIENPFEKQFPDTLEGRINRCAFIVENLSLSQKKQPILSQQINFYKNLQHTLKRQKRNRDNAADKKLTEAYSDNATSAVQRLYRKTTANMNAPENLENIKKLISMMKNSSVDPNLELEDNSIDGGSEHILKVAVSSKIFTPELRNELISILIKRNVLTDCLTGMPTNTNLLNKELLAYGIDPLAGLLLYAVKNQQPEIVRLLINCGADVNEADTNGNTVLHWAVRLNDSSLVKLLLTAGADANKVNKGDLQTPLFWAEKFANDIIVEMLQKVQSSDNYMDIYGKKASDYRYSRNFNEAIRENNITKITELLERYPEMANNYLANGMTPLQYACNEYNPTMVKILLQSHSELNKKSRRHPELPLQTAFKMFYTENTLFNLKKGKSLEIFKMLVNAGADFYVPFSVGAQTPIIHYVLLNYDKITGNTEEYLNVMLKHIDISQIPELTAVLYSSPDTQKKDNTKRIKILKKLLALNSNLNSNEGSPIIALAGSSLSVTEEELQLLLSKQADINSLDAQGRNAIFRLCEKACDKNNSQYLEDYADRITFLAEHGADVSCSVDGRTIADMNLPPAITHLNIIKNFRRKSGK